MLVLPHRPSSNLAGYKIQCISLYLSKVNKDNLALDMKILKFELKPQACSLTVRSHQSN